MYLARIDGTLTSTRKHETLVGCRLLLAQRLEANGRAVGEPIVVIDRLGARHGSTVIVSTDGEALRRQLGDTTPARLSVVGIVDEVAQGRLTEPVPGSVPSRGPFEMDDERGADPDLAGRRSTDSASVGARQIEEAAFPAEPPGVGPAGDSAKAGRQRRKAGEAAR
jgi:ethanolamine utilization protein EutN